MQKKNRKHYHGIAIKNPPKPVGTLRNIWESQKRFSRHPRTFENLTGDLVGTLAQIGPPQAENFGDFRHVSWIFTRGNSDFRASKPYFFLARFARRSHNLYLFIFIKLINNITLFILCCIIYWLNKNIKI